MVPFIARLFLYGIIFIYSYIYCSEQVKIPSQCEALSALRPVQIVGGEQTLFAVTAEGKVRISPLFSDIYSNSILITQSKSYK